MSTQSTILIVDDDAMFRRVMARQLENAGFAVQHHESGRGVAQAVEALKPVADVLDMVLPDKEGMETIMDIDAAQLRAEAIAVSGTHQLLDYAQGLLIASTMI